MRNRPIRQRLLAAGSFVATVGSLAQAGTAQAQTTAAQTDSSPSEQAGDEAARKDIVVTGSRINRAGFDQPTPTTVLGDVELRQGARPNVQQVLNDQPQFRPTTTPQVSVGNTTTGTAPVDLRGLGTNRTLTLIDGRRFVGQNNLNFVPTGLIERVEVVTGGASAAWGSNAVAGVVNLILKDKFQGLTLGGQSGISSRGDGFRYGADATFGTGFADGKGNFLVGVEYVDDKGIPDRNSRSNLGSAGIVRVNPLSTTDLSTQLVRDVNYGNQAADGLITSGVLAGQIFNQDGTLRPFRGGTRLGAAAFPGQMIGGQDGIGLYDDIAASTPFDRLSAYARVSYDLGGPTVYVDGLYGRSTSDSPFIPDFTIAPLAIQATNPFLSSAIRGQLAAAGQTSFTLGRVFDDAYLLNLKLVRENFEGAIGIKGALGGERFKYSAYYSHGEIHDRQRVGNSRLVANYNRAINAVSSGGQIVCAVNADADPTNNDPACAPLNPFGRYNVSQAALDYTRGTQQLNIVSKLDAAGVQVQGDLFSLWAGPVTAAVGAEARWEKQISTNGALDRAGAFGPLNLFGGPVSGGFNVKEGFAELALPLINAEGKIKLDANGAARYSDFSTSGGVWSWKLGGTARLFNDVLLRVVGSRDIRSPNVGELFGTQSLTIGPLVDQDNPTGRAAANPGYNRAPAQVRSNTGGNPNLDQEFGKTLTIGGSFSPSFFSGFNLSVDYYKIKIAGAITALSGSTLTLACSLGNQEACSRVTRDATGTVTEVFANQQNIANFETRGIDIEASYLLPLSRLSAAMPGALRMRVLATHIDRLVFDTGVARVDTAGDVGDALQRATPKWRGTFSTTYQTKALGLDLRVRYIDGGNFNSALTTLVNNRISSRTYVDLGAQIKVQDRFTLFGNVNNVFDRGPPISTVGNTNYDIIGTYYTAGARVKF